MAGLDIETDTIPTPESSKYNTLLENIISDYRRPFARWASSRRRPPSVLVERFADLEERLKNDRCSRPKSRSRRTYDLPIKMNDRVKSSIVVSDRGATPLSLFSRRPKWDSKGTLPQPSARSDLFCLVDPDTISVSWARASGLWQFIASTDVSAIRPRPVDR
jgi:hypothetical protein